MQYRPAFAVKWNAIAETVLQRYSDCHRSMVMEPIYALMATIPLPITRGGIEDYLREVAMWIQANKYPFGGCEVWLEDVYIVIREDDRLIAEMEVDEQRWQVIQCTV